MYDELIKALRCFEDYDGLDFLENRTYAQDIAREAADAIEEIETNYDAATDIMKHQTEYIEELEAKLPRWIPVTERLPVGGDDSGAVCENVCLMMDDGTVSCGWMNGITKKVYYLNARDDFIIKAPITRVTHWMPLPTPPTEEEGE